MLSLMSWFPVWAPWKGFTQSSTMAGFLKWPGEKGKEGLDRGLEGQEAAGWVVQGRKGEEVGRNGRGSLERLGGVGLMGTVPELLLRSRS